MACHNQIRLAQTFFNPRGDPYSFRLSFDEPRLNFAMNIGSRSSIVKVPVYTPKEVNKQLDMVTCLTLGDSAGDVETDEKNQEGDDIDRSSSGGGAGVVPMSNYRNAGHGVVLNLGKATVTLPKIMQWYKHDFGSDPLALVNFSRKFLSAAQISLLDEMLESHRFGAKKLKVKFHEFSPVCTELLPFDIPPPSSKTQSPDLLDSFVDKGTTF